MLRSVKEHLQECCLAWCLAIWGPDTADTSAHRYSPLSKPCPVTKMQCEQPVAVCAASVHAASAPEDRLLAPDQAYLDLEKHLEIEEWIDQVCIAREKLEKENGKLLPPDSVPAVLPDLPTRSSDDLKKNEFYNPVKRSAHIQL
jgi:hypothetical protein